MVKTFAVIGDPIDHSLSPLVHNAAFKELKLDCTYIAYRIPKGELEAGIESLKSINITGFNVTTPHKVEMMQFIDEAEKNCSIIGATNTVLNEQGKLKGFNTDMEGFLDPIRSRNLNIKKANILLMGAGGAARAIVAGFAQEKANKISIANRTNLKAERLVEFAQKIGIESEIISLKQAEENLSKFNFIVNATSIGLQNEPSPISTNNIKSDSVVYDIVYKPMNTDLIKQSKKNGATVIYGYEMFLSQAARSFEIWHGEKAPIEVMKRAILGGF